MCIRDSLYLSRRDAGSSVNYDTNSYAFGGLGSQSLSLAGGTNLTIGANMQGAALSLIHISQRRHRHRRNPLHARPPARAARRPEL